MEEGGPEEGHSGEDISGELPGIDIEDRMPEGGIGPFAAFPVVINLSDPLLVGDGVPFEVDPATRAVTLTADTDCQPYHGIEHGVVIL